ncbi:hypothetical protein RBA41_16230 [Massilia sp. CCM 9210]|uniref:hypothetical protein n=1 Tax=Massilia scottii TaxID=3057166 RepID=UPI0027966B0B|nr:hypothetical protein [Massilia sp. CCM 9210]MDQ1814856.1 hypothetical protein [Massilia sp. CCM 9210]
MPRYARFAQYLLIAVLLYAAVRSGWRFAADSDSCLELALIAWLCAAIVGLWRRVAWGRFFASCFSVVLAFTSSWSLIPLAGPMRYQTLLHEIVSISPSLAWLFVVTAATLILMPAFLIGIRRDWFRSAWW